MSSADRDASVGFVVPEGIDDPAHPSGGNAYDRRLSQELAALGWAVQEYDVAGSWPRPRPTEQVALARLLAGFPDHATVLVDGLVASAAADAIVPEAGRLRLVVLLHMPLAEAVPGEAAARTERAVLTAAAAVVTTSGWARRWVLTHHGVPAGSVHVAEPGADLGPLASGTAGGGELLCVAAITPGKGHDTLLAALARVRDLDWRCTCAGALDLDPGFVEDLRAIARRSGIEDRVRFLGALTPERLADARLVADLTVSASRRESFGMAVAEGLARGIPAVATDVGGQPEALGRNKDGTRPGLLVPAGDPDRLAAELRRWLTDPDLRGRLRGSAAGRRTGLVPWATTAHQVADVLAGVRPVNRTRPEPVSPITTQRTTDRSR